MSQRLIGLLLFACATMAVQCQPAPAGRVEAQRWATALIDALNSHRLERFGPLLGTASYTDPLTGGPRQGPPLAYYLATMFTVFPQLRYEIQRVENDGNTVIIEWSLVGAGGTSKDHPLLGVFVIELDGAAISAVRAYFDPRPLGGLRLPAQPLRAARG